MTNDPAPSTDWKERIAPDEAERYAKFATQFAEIQARKSKRHGAGRALHRKQLSAAQGTLEVLDGLPHYAHFGLFAVPHDYEVWVRLSNGGMDRAPDKVPDIRGFALRVLGVRGNSALGNGPAVSQDFTLINQEAFAFAGSTEFVEFAVAASRGNAELFKYIFKRYGLLGAPRQLGKMIKVVKKPFTGFATETLFSALPMANGPYAVRVRLVPSAANGKPESGAHNDWSADFAARLRKGPLHWDMQLQFFASEALTPIEDASVNWTTPYSTVARLMLPQQDLDSPDAKTFAERVEGSVIDPWQALVEHRPLGDVQRARKVVYFQSQKGRGAS
ncbi:catalase [Caenimonas sedimenti]|uniref:Catalase n=1 Tax=Caenimonas sedimenti TaxID=2596921 RepID=A0A562ZXL9_9BURK|nr:catalase [Caenimonas sedimenti]TWO73107.1 catalase [Caenimonas sedimenti]